MGSRCWWRSTKAVSGDDPRTRIPVRGVGQTFSISLAVLSSLSLSLSLSVFPSFPECSSTPSLPVLQRTFPFFHELLDRSHRTNRVESNRFAVALCSPSARLLPPNQRRTHAPALR